MGRPRSRTYPLSAPGDDQPTTTPDLTVESNTRLQDSDSGSADSLVIIIPAGPDKITAKVVTRARRGKRKREVSPPLSPGHGQLGGSRKKQRAHGEVNNVGGSLQGGGAKVVGATLRLTEPVGEDEVEKTVIHSPKGLELVVETQAPVPGSAMFPADGGDYPAVWSTLVLVDEINEVRMEEENGAYGHGIRVAVSDGTFSQSNLGPFSPALGTSPDARTERVDGSVESGIWKEDVSEQAPVSPVDTEDTFISLPDSLKGNAHKDGEGCNPAASSAA